MGRRRRSALAAARLADPAAAPYDFELAGVSAKRGLDHDRGGVIDRDGRRVVHLRRHAARHWLLSRGEKHGGREDHHRSTLAGARYQPLKAQNASSGSAMIVSAPDSILRRSEIVSGMMRAA